MDKEPNKIKIEQSWEKDFDKIVAHCGEPYWPDWEKVRSFISEQIQKSRQEGRKRILNLLQKNSKKEINKVVFLDTQIEAIKALIKNGK